MGLGYAFWKRNWITLGSIRKSWDIKCKIKLVGILLRGLFWDLVIEFVSIYLLFIIPIILLVIFYMLPELNKKRSMEAAVDYRASQPKIDSDKDIKDFRGNPKSVSAKKVRYNNS